jgi:hypothetical protein
VVTQLKGTLGRTGDGESGQRDQMPTRRISMPAYARFARPNPARHIDNVHRHGGGYTRSP